MEQYRYQYRHRTRSRAHDAFAGYSYSYNIARIMGASFIFLLTIFAETTMVKGFVVVAHTTTTTTTTRTLGISTERSSSCGRCVVCVSTAVGTKAVRTSSTSALPVRRLCLSMSSTGDDDADTSTNNSNRQWSSSVSQQQNQQERTNRAIQTLMARHDPILLFASKLLPPNKAGDASVLYAWCRRLDEICDSDENSDNPELVRTQLDVWQERFENLWSSDGITKATATSTATATTTTTTTTAIPYSEDEYLMDLALKECIERYQRSGSDGDDDMLTRKPFDDMIEGMKSDAVDKRRIRNMEELELYAYRVAGTVGLMLLPLLLTPSSSDGDHDHDGDSTATTTTKSSATAVETATEPAICLGKAIQLVNILRDATQDAKLGRIYLPQDMLREEGVTEQDETELLLQSNASASNPGGSTPDGYKRVVRKVSDRADELLALAEEGRSTLPAPLGPLLVQVIVELYRDYLQELERRDYDNLSSSSIKGRQQDRVKISTLRKVQASLRAIIKVFLID